MYQFLSALPPEKVRQQSATPFLFFRLPWQKSLPAHGSHLPLFTGFHVADPGFSGPVRKKPLTIHPSTVAV